MLKTKPNAAGPCDMCKQLRISVSMVIVIRERKKKSGATGKTPSFSHKSVFWHFAPNPIVFDVKWAQREREWHAEVANFRAVMRGKGLFFYLFLFFPQPLHYDTEINLTMMHRVISVRSRVMQNVTTSPQNVAVIVKCLYNLVSNTFISGSCFL